MIKSNILINSAEKAEKNFENIKKTIKGLMEIIRIYSPSETDIYLQLARDNIIVLYQNLIDLILNDDGVKQLKQKLKDSEIKLENLSNELLK